VPAKIEKSIIEKIRKVSLQAYTALHCEDFARVDLFLAEDGKIYVNEINTIPGFTNSSMFPMMWKERGISFTELINKLLDIAIERHKQGKRIGRDFNSSLKF
jgi:D-alanine-D-alanine ligase